jgi:drug/metabolite transporter (DMT)-like permease
MTKPINGAVLMMVTPLFVAIFDHWKNRQTPTMETVFGMIIGSAGAILLMGGNGVNFTASTLEGDIWVAVNAMFYAIYLVMVKSLVHKYSPITVNRVTFSMGVIYLAPFGASALWHTNFDAIPADIWWKIGYTLLFTSFLVYLLNAYGIKHGSPTLVGLYIYLQPVLATIIALALGRDELSANKLIFAGMVLFGVWLVLGNNRRRFSFKTRFGK